MAERKPSKTAAWPSAKSSRVVGKASTGFTDEERAAMKGRARELKAEARRGPRADKADRESAVLAKIGQMAEPDRTMGERLNEIINASAPVLSPRLWYGMPAYAQDGKVVCFFRSAQKFKLRYATLGFNDEANPRRGRHVADLLWGEGVNGRGRETDRSAREESCHCGTTGTESEGTRKYVPDPNYAARLERVNLGDSMITHPTFVEAIGADRPARPARLTADARARHHARLARGARRRDGNSAATPVV